MQTAHPPTVPFAVPADLDFSAFAANLASRALEQRLDAVWFAGASPIADEREVSPLRAAVLWEALPKFLADEGWQIVAALPVARHDDELASVDLRAISHDADRSLVVPINMAVYARRGADRRVMTFQHQRSDWAVRVAGTDSDLPACWHRWEEQAFGASVLRERVIDPRGRRLLAGAALNWGNLFLP